MSRLRRDGAEGCRPFLGRNGQVQGLLQLPISCRLSEQQLGELVGTQFGQRVNRELVLFCHRSIIRDIESEVDISYITRAILGWLVTRDLAMRYDANDQPDTETWLDLDETERVDLVIDYHRRTRVQLDSLELHAVTHVVVENQVALGDATPVPATLDRLIAEGLDRHEAIHAIGSVLMNIVLDVVREADDGRDINAKYGRALAALTATGWRSQV